MPSVMSIFNMNRQRKNYKSEEDVTLIFNSATKKDLTNDPTLRYFKAGVNKDVYWNSSYAKKKLEDVLDFLVVIFSQFDFKLLCDQSSGHCKVREDGLVMNNMNVSDGG